MTEQPRVAGQENSGPAPGGSAPDGSAAERVVIRDKRKLKVADGKDDSTEPSGTGDTDLNAAVGDTTGGADAEGASSPDAEGASSPDADGAAGVEDADPEQPVVDDAELAEVLAAESPVGDGAPVVDEPAEPVSGTPDTEPVDGALGEAARPLGAELEALRAELDERTRDLQRVSAEYANYRKRVDRDRGLVAEQATGTVLAALLPIMDDLDRARDHGDLVGPFGTVAEQLVGALGKFGLIAFGEKGDPFDPTRHEAVAHQVSPDVTEPTCVDVMRRGYLLVDRMLRPALVTVADPE